MPQDDNKRNHTPDLRHDTEALASFISSQPTAIANHVENLSRLNVQALNARDFNPASPGWSFISPDFKCNAIYDGPNPDGEKPDRFLTLEEYKQRLEAFVREHSEWQLMLVSQQTQLDAKKRDQAQVFEVYEISGFPPGLTTIACFTVDFAFSEGRWWCHRRCSVRGVGWE